MFTTKLSIVLLSSLLSFSALASYQRMGDEDVLFSISKKLIQIEERIMSQTISVTPETLNWPELEDFTKDLMFIVAHDPQGLPPKNVPKELASDKLTERLRGTWLRLSESVARIGSLSGTPEWLSLKTDMEKFFEFRQELLYQSARVMIKTGLLTEEIKLLRSAAAVAFSKTSQQGTKISVRISDPGIDALASELKILSRKVSAMEAFRKPAPPEVPTIFQRKNALELGLTAGGAFFMAIIAAATFTLISRVLKKHRSESLAHEDSPPVETVLSSTESQFDYDDWLKRLEKNLKALRKNDDVQTEDMLCLINYSHDLRDARLSMNKSATPDETAGALRELNSASLKIEAYFEKINFKKHSETSRNIMRHLVEICEAIENRREIKVQDKSDPGTDVVRLKLA